MGIVDVFKELLAQAKIRYNLSPAVQKASPVSALLLDEPPAATAQDAPDGQECHEELFSCTVIT